jgi:hypothetical protein
VAVWQDIKQDLIDKMNESLLALIDSIEKLGISRLSQPSSLCSLETEL